MPATAAYQAGVDTNSAVLSFAQEDTWGVVPAAKTFNRLRFTGESLAPNRSSARTNEIDGFRSASEDVTNQNAAGGDINFAFSAINFDEFIAGCAGNDWANNALVDGSMFKSYTIQKQLSSGLFLLYPGAYVNSVSLTMNTGTFMTGKSSFIAKSEISANSPVNTTALAAPDAGRVLNTMTNIQSISLGVAGTSIDAVVDQLTLDLNNTGAALEFGLGSAGGQGVNPGAFTVSGTMRAYFRSFSIYQYFTQEILNAFTINLVTAAGKTYTLTFPQTKIMNPKINAGGKGAPVMATFGLTMQRDPNSGATISFART